jgi:hypothetical protein
MKDVSRCDVISSGPHGRNRPTRDRHLRSAQPVCSCRLKGSYVNRRSTLTPRIASSANVTLPTIGVQFSNPGCGRRVSGGTAPGGVSATAMRASAPSSSAVAKRAACDSQARSRSEGERPSRVGLPPGGYEASICKRGAEVDRLQCLLRCLFSVLRLVPVARTRTTQPLTQNLLRHLAVEGA